jgi:pectate lyase C
VVRALFTGIVCLFAGSLRAQPVPITGATCVSTGTVVVSTTIRITSGTYDGGCRTYLPGPGMDLNSHSETVAARSVLFRVENGARLRNVIISPSPWLASARAINIYAGATLENINITKVSGEIAISVKSAGTVNISKITSVDSVETHINAIGVNTMVRISNCIFKNARKVYRQNGGSTYPTIVTIDRCDISGMRDQVFRTDSAVATAALTNSRLHDVRTVCTGYAAGKCITSGNVIY